MTFLNVYRVYKLIGVEAGRPQEALLCAKAKRQQQSAQSERKSITRYANKLFLEKVNNKKKIIGIYSVIYNFQI
ncbi:hypothetical protein ACPCXA_13480 [Lysinibacillus agricola]